MVDAVEPVVKLRPRRTLTTIKDQAAIQEATQDQAAIHVVSGSSDVLSHDKGDGHAHTKVAKVQFAPQHHVVNSGLEQSGTALVPAPEDKPPRIDYSVTVGLQGPELGITVTGFPPNLMQVGGVLGGGAAASQGVAIGDALVSIDAIGLQHMSLDRIQKGLARRPATFGFVRGVLTALPEHGYPRAAPGMRVGRALVSARVASATGVRVGDRLTAVGNLSIPNLSRDDLVSSFSAPSSVKLAFTHQGTNTQAASSTSEVEVRGGQKLFAMVPQSGRPGIRAGQLVQGHPDIQTPGKSSPQTGDTLTHIGGRPVKDMSAREVLTALRAPNLMEFERQLDENTKGQTKCRITRDNIYVPGGLWCFAEVKPLQ
eukprot:gnl/MRDRNA2_/MRDRNA2_33104_c0_seq1.p1 gnl/MRDRNA2_/MRDRNA2_33104_c0~~gnl/MRDRNA2_/MRDRNA2_33104_c0_seq1.p1  ORF type:complete len:408 (+),score=53.23 gnl/MRDRNA2_/MRDRNA2_33104_c0_seq1:115-1224(+)